MELANGGYQRKDKGVGANGTEVAVTFLDFIDALVEVFPVLTIDIIPDYQPEQSLPVRLERS